MNDPFFSGGGINGVHFDFKNQIGSGSAPTNWTAVNGDASGWLRNGALPVRPYEEIFLLHSSETTYRLGTNGNGGAAYFSFNAMTSDINSLGAPGYPFVIAGAGSLPCLVPCRPEEADGLPANFSSAFKIMPDIPVKLLQEGGSICSVDFDWPYESTFALEASTDLQTWTTVGYLWSYTPKTYWESDEPLNDYGKYFRLEVVAAGHRASPPPLNP